MSEKINFYRIIDYSSKVVPGSKIQVERSISPQRENIDLSLLISKPLEELQAMRKYSASEEQAIFDILCKAARTWDAQAAQTLQLDMAIEYAKMPPVQHTSNEWVKREYDYQEISNMVYLMNYRVYEETKYNQEAPVAWELTWGVRTNPPDRQRGNQIAGQNRKRFSDKAAMEKYLNGRIKAYSHLFTEISPPIPQEYADSFKVNGQLLPGYIADGEEEKPVDRNAGVKPSVLQQIREARETPPHQTQDNGLSGHKKSKVGQEL